VSKTYRVALTRSAAEDAEAAYLWIAERAPAAAARWFNELERRVESLASMPNRCPEAPESAAFHKKIRHLLFGKYRVLFHVSRNVVYVLHVRHGAMLPLPP